MKIEEILKEKGVCVFCVSLEASVAEAIKKLNEHNIGSLVVLDEKTEICGILTERDILRNFKKCAHDKPKVKEVMTKNPIIGFTGDDVDKAMKIMTNNRIRHLPIMEDRKLVGIISIGDLLKSMHDHQEVEIRYLTNYISGSYMS